MDFKKRLLNRIIRLALDEDMVKYDITTNSLLPYDSRVKATVIAKEKGIIAGVEVFRAVFEKIDKKVDVTVLKNDSSTVRPGDQVLQLEGMKSSILRGERTALNFLQRLSGIATLTSIYVTKLEGSGITLLDTRKTTPGMRYLEKEAVVAGGGTNHRMNLADMAMIKDNHIRMAGSITTAVTSIRKKFPGKEIEVEVTNMDELSEALEADADIIMLDNFDEDLLSKAVSLKNKKVKFEISGNVTIENINEKRIEGIDFISSGALTHSFKSLDLSLEIIE